MASGGCKDNMSEETFDFICTSCADGGVIKEAVKYCVECQGYCCKFCVDMHAKFPVLKSHTLLDDLTSTSTRQQPGLLEIPTERCKIHKTKLLDMFCKQHDTVGCYVCFAENHKLCKGPHSIIDQLYTESAYKQTSVLLQDMTKTIRTLKETSMQQLIDLKKSKKNAIDAINALRKEIESMLDKIEEQTLQEFEDEYQKIKPEKLKEQTYADDTMELLRKLEDQMRQAGENRSQRFVCMKLAGANIADVKQTATEVQLVEQLVFVPHSTLTDLLQQLHHLGEFNVSSKLRQEVYKIKEKKINIKLSNDNQRCDSWGSCLTEDDMLIITDFNNKKLKRVDANTLSIVDYCDLPNAPYGVCCMNEQEIAVACASNAVQFVKIDKSITLSRKVRLNHCCLGIAFNDHKLYITDGSNRVFMYDMSGTLLQKFTHDKAGKQLLTRSRHITISKTTGTVFVGDWHKGFICLDDKLNHIASFSDSKLQLADGVCDDGRGNIFVVGYESDNIAQFSEDGTVRGIVVSTSDGIQSPRTVCFHQRINRLFVTMNSNNFVRVYDLQ